MTDDFAVLAKKLRVRRQKTDILHGLNLTIRRGAITGLIGPSGSGKTTLMRAIVGVQVREGTLTVLGKSAGDKSLRPRIGYVTQSPAVYGDLTVLQNLEYFAAMVGVERREAHAAIEHVQLTQQERQLVQSLSGGQRARVSLAVALLGSPDLLVLDEPTVGLDPILRNDLWRLFAELATQGKTLIVSSHVMDEAERCDDVVLLRSGRVLWDGSRTALLKRNNTKSVGDAFVAMIEEAAHVSR